jgi:hypothetical protein
MSQTHRPPFVRPGGGAAGGGGGGRGGTDRNGLLLGDTRTPSGFGIGGEGFDSIDHIGSESSNGGGGEKQILKSTLLVTFI